MNPSTEIFDLIKTLTKTEKRYFRLCSSLQKGSKNYLMLFNQIDRMKKYDETRLKGSFKRLTFTKNYLYNAIIKSLTAYNTDNTKKVRLQDQLIRLKILYHKSLFRQFYKMLTVLKLRARETENFTVYHEILKLEIQSIKTGDYKDVDLIKILTEVKNVLAIIQNLNEYTLTSAMLKEETRRNGILRDRESLNKISKLMENPVIKKGIDVSSTNREKESFQKLMSDYNYLKGDLGRVIENNKARLEVVINNRKMFEEDYVLKVIEIYGAILYGCVKLERFHEFRSYFNCLKNLDTRSNLEKAMHFSKLYLYEFLYLLKKENFKKGVELVRDAEVCLKKYEDTIQKDDLLIIRYYICRTYFGAGDYERALEYSNFLLNHPFIHYRSDVHIYCRILNLIIHYELENYDLLPHIIKSVYRFLYKKRKIYRFEKIILDFLKDLKHSDTRMELKDRLTILKADMLKLYEDPFEKNAFNYFEFLSWFDRKIKAA
jgi:hypothetical protein